MILAFSSIWWFLIWSYWHRSWIFLQVTWFLLLAWSYWHIPSSLHPPHIFDNLLLAWSCWHMSSSTLTSNILYNFDSLFLPCSCWHMSRGILINLIVCSCHGHVDTCQEIQVAWKLPLVWSYWHKSRYLFPYVEWRLCSQWITAGYDSGKINIKNDEQIKCI